MARGVVFNIQRFCLHDGPGIRTTVFLKGCPLRCQWCHNPEAMAVQPEANQEGRILGEYRTADAVLAEVLKDRAYYEKSGGGLTLSGGEPLFQFGFARALLRQARQEGLHICLDTAGHVPQKHLAAVLEDVDLFLFDIKAHDAALHRALTAVDNQRILANLDYLYRAGAAIRLRCPLIPGVNDSAGHLQFIAGLARRYPRLEGIEIMPFHDMAAGKWTAVGKSWALEGLASAGESDRARWLAQLAALGCENAAIG